MEISDKRVKLLFAVFAAVLLIAFLPLNASAQASAEFVNETPTESNLYKYLHHVNVTLSPWRQPQGNAAGTYFNPTSAGPKSDHLLWVAKTRPYEGLSTGSIVVTNGKVIVATSSGHSIYSPVVLYAFDQNTGQKIWAYPGLSGGILIDDQHLLCGTTMINPDTGQFINATIPRALQIYDPVSKLGFGSGPSPGRGASTVMGWDYSDPEKPKQLWVSQPQEISLWIQYDDGKVFYGGRDQYNLIAADARTGTVLWDITVPDYITAASAANGKLFATGWTGGLCYDQQTGQLLWRMPSHNREFGTGAIAYGKIYVHEANHGLYAIDVNTGGMVWRYVAEREAPFPHSQDTTVGAKVTTDQSQSPSVADGKVYFNALDPTRYGALVPAKWKSIDGTMWNPYDFPVLAQPGTSELVCLDAESGKLLWKSGVEEIGSPGPCVDEPIVADGRVYGAQRTYTGHVGVASARQYTTLNNSQLINYEWYPPQVYSWGQGPTQFQDVTVNKIAAKFGENITVSGKLVDLSPPIKDLSILSTFQRDIASPAKKVPVALSFIGSDGAKVPFATAETDKDGKFSATFYPWETGSLSIIVESAGSSAYEAPDTVYTSLFVEAIVPDMVPLLEFALVVAIVIAIAVPVIIYISKPKHTYGNQNK